jgi:hypothetical protein
MPVIGGVRRAGRVRATCSLHTTGPAVCLVPIGLCSRSLVGEVALLVLMPRLNIGDYHI